MVAVVAVVVGCFVAADVGGEAETEGGRRSEVVAVVAEEIVEVEFAVVVAFELELEAAGAAGSAYIVGGFGDVVREWRPSSRPRLKLESSDIPEAGSWTS